jgi:hypothetical protein
MSTLPKGVLLWEFLHSGAQGGVYGVCCKIEDCQQDTSNVILFIHGIVVIIILVFTMISICIT